MLDFIFSYNLLVIKMLAYTGGKTGGHIYPLIRLIEEDNKKALYIGYKNSLEEKICNQNDKISFIGLNASNSKNKYLKAIKGYKELNNKLKNYKIEAIISSGGFVAIPACIYAIKNKIPLFLLEENLVVGRVNELFYPFCKKMYLGYELDKMKKKYMLTGLPIKKIDNSTLNNEYDILIIGGSLGSKKLCELAIGLKDEYKCLLIAGNYYLDYEHYSNIKVIDYSNDIISLMKKSKIIIARAGAQTSAEIFKVNKPYICIPSLNTMKNHQYINALYFKNKGACIMCDENSLEELKSNINNILNNDSIIINMKASQNKLSSNNAANTILKSIRESI